MAKVQTAQTRGYTLLPEGPRNFVVAGVRQREGNLGPYIEVRLMDLETEQVAYTNRSLAGENPWAFFEFTQACGLSDEDAADIDWDTGDADIVLGIVIVGDVYHERYQGRMRHKIGAVSPATPVDQVFDPDMNPDGDPTVTAAGDARTVAASRQEVVNS